jgi:hypothetical protein
MIRNFTAANCIVSSWPPGTVFLRGARCFGSGGYLRPFAPDAQYGSGPAFRRPKALSIAAGPPIPA